MQSMKLIFCCVNVFLFTFAVLHFECYLTYLFVIMNKTDMLNLIVSTDKLQIRLEFSAKKVMRMKLIDRFWKRFVSTQRRKTSIIVLLISKVVDFNIEIRELILAIRILKKFELNSFYDLSITQTKALSYRQIANIYSIRLYLRCSKCINNPI